jgi:hypothetical protein
MSISRPNQTDRCGRTAGVETSSRGDAIRLSGDRRLQVERTKAGVQLPMALFVKLDRPAEALHVT